MEVAVKAADESFVIAAEAAENGGEAGLDLLGIFGFEVVVKQDDDGEREGFRGEKFQALFDTVIEDAKLAAGEVGDQAAVAVLDGDGEKDVVYGKLQGGLAVGRGLLIRRNLGVLLAGFRWRWCVSGNLRDRGGGWFLSEHGARAKQAGR
jgi:hypothetical protein